MSLADATRWSKDDLDRCEHGRHSIDNCFSCPNGWSTGNLFLIPNHHQVDLSERMRRTEGTLEVRIGTQVHGRPIWVVVQDALRG